MKSGTIIIIIINQTYIVEDKKIKKVQEWQKVEQILLRFIQWVFLGLSSNWRDKHECFFVSDHTGFLLGSTPRCDPENLNSRSMVI